MVKLIGERALNLVITGLPGVRGKMREEASAVADAAKAGLEEARASTRWFKIIGPGHLTFVDTSHGDVDAFANLHAPNPMAIEFGHEPSGVFGPGGRYAGTKTKAPEGLYILHRAAGFGLF